MNLDNKKILFICHDGGRTGAPILLLHLLTWFKRNTALTFEVLLLADGPLRKDLAALAPVHLYPSEHAHSSLVKRIARRLGWKQRTDISIRHLVNVLTTRNFDLIYANTIVTGHALAALAPLNCPTITHVHELDYWIEKTGVENLQLIKQYSKRYIAASLSVKENLVINRGIPADLIDVVHAFIDAHNLPANPLGIRQRLGIPEDSFVVIGSGHETWRKGKDLFVQLAALLGPEIEGRQVHSVWVGGWESELDQQRIMHDVKHLGLSRHLHFIGMVTNPIDYFAAGDVFAMVSREDPFPLVCLEAAAVGKPILCFANAGGMPEFVEEDAGYVVPYLDTIAIAKRMVELARVKTYREKMGEVACQKVKINYDVNVQAKLIYKLIKRLLVN